MKVFTATFFVSWHIYPDNEIVRTKPTEIMVQGKNREGHLSPSKLDGTEVMSGRLGVWGPALYSAFYSFLQIDLVCEITVFAMELIACLQ